MVRPGSTSKHPRPNNRHAVSSPNQSSFDEDTAGSGPLCPFLLARMQSTAPIQHSQETCQTSCLMEMEALRIQACRRQMRRTFTILQLDDHEFGTQDGNDQPNKDRNHEGQEEHEDGIRHAGRTSAPHRIHSPTDYLTERQESRRGIRTRLGRGSPTVRSICTRTLGPGLLERACTK